MSTCYALTRKVRAADFLDGRLEAFGVCEHVAKNTTATAKCLTDGQKYLWMYVDEAGFVSRLTRYGANAPAKILQAIATAFDTDIFSEHEPQYWGFNSQQEWDAALQQIARKDEDAFYTELIKFICGQSADIREGTVGWIEAQIAKDLVNDDPQLTLPDERERLMNAIKVVYDRDHAVHIKLASGDIAASGGDVDIALEKGVQRVIELLTKRDDDVGHA
jgi:hypothetical protein